MVIESGAQSPKNGSMRLFHAFHQVLYRVEGASRDHDLGLNPFLLRSAYRAGYLVDSTGRTDCPSWIEKGSLLFAQDR
jgi:hypothetical protein